MIHKLKHFLWDLRDRQRIVIALTKGGAMMHARTIDLQNPQTWEFSGFSQNGEDGILDVLRCQLRQANRYFIEIGTSDGIENNCAWLVVAERYNGLMVEGNARLVERARRTMVNYSIGAECVQLFVGRDNLQQLLDLAMHPDPDVFSLDIDGIDYYIAEAVIQAGLRPKIFVVEYNSVFGPHRSCTIEYADQFVFTKAHPTQLYYGVSITGWRNFFNRHGYRFVTVDRNGVNAFFVDPQHFHAEFLASVNGIAFAENAMQRRKFRRSAEEQFKLIEDQRYVEIR